MLIEAKIGKSIDTVARLEVISVKDIIDYLPKNIYKQVTIELEKNERIDINETQVVNKELFN